MRRTIAALVVAGLASMPACRFHSSDCAELDPSCDPLAAYLSFRYASTLLTQVFFVPAAGGELSRSDDNGATWTTGNLPTSNLLAGIAVSDTNMLVAGGGVGGTGEIFYSTDRGITWQTGNLPAGTQLVRRVAYGNGLWVAIGNGGQIRTSTDGINWSAATSPTANNLRDILYTDGLFLVGADGNEVVRSTDGINWSLASSAPPFQSYGVATDGAGRFVACGVTGVRASFSTDAGNTWTDATSGPGVNVQCAAYINGAFVCGGIGQDIYRSTDGGANWTAVSTAGADGLNGCDGSDSGVVMAGVNGVIMTSSDGVSWVEISPRPSSQTANGADRILFNDTQFSFF